MAEDIKVGDWIKVPKGILLTRDYSGHTYRNFDTTINREITVQVSEVQLTPYWWKFLSDEDTIQWRIQQYKPDRPPLDYWHDLARKHCGHSLMEALWSKGKKGALFGDVELVPEPQRITKAKADPKSKAPPPINKRQQMVKGSRWRFTRDVVISYNVANPKIREEMDRWLAANPRPAYSHSGTRDADAQWSKDYRAERLRLDEVYEKTIPQEYARIPKDTLVEVSNKFLSQWNPFGLIGGEVASNVAQMTKVGDPGKLWLLEYNQIKDHVEAESIPTVNVWVLREKSSGRFFKSTQLNEEKTKAAQAAKGAQWSVWHEHAVYDAITVDAFMKAKHFDSVGRAKTSVLMMTGYYDGLPGADESLPEWSGGPANFTMTDDWELVQFDKLGRKEVGVVDDFQSWFKRAWELRELTMRYGSSVRTVYQALDKAGKLEEQSGVAVFMASEDKVDHAMNYGERTALTAEDKAEIESAISGMKKGSFKRAIDHKSAAVSFASKSDALMFKLAYTGDLKITVIDLREMKEAVDG